MGSVYQSDLKLARLYTVSHCQPICLLFTQKSRGDDRRKTVIPRGKAIEKNVVGSSVKRRQLKLPFLVLLAVSLCLWCYSILTTSVDRIPISNFPILSMMPLTYWFGVAALILATICWYFSTETRWYHFLLLLPWTLYIFIGPELVEAGIRGYDTVDHLLGVTYIDQGRFAEYYYKDWPGFISFSSFLYKITGVSYYVLPKLVSISLHLLRTIGILYLGASLFTNKKHVLLFSLLLVGAFWENQSFDPCPQHLAIIIMMPSLSLFFSTKHLDTKRIVLIMFLFLALLITHVLTPFVVALLVLFLGFMSLIRRDFGYNRGNNWLIIGILFSIGFAAYLMYATGWVFQEAVNALIKALYDPLLATQFLIPYSPYQQFVIYLAYSFYAVFILWMFIIAGRKEFWTKPLERIFPLLCLIPFSFVVIPYGLAALPRFYILGVPFIIWFLVKESVKLRHGIIISFLVVMMLLSFGERYAVEYVTYVPTEEFAGARFICSKIPLLSKVMEVAPFDPAPRSMANSLTQPIIVGLQRYIQPDGSYYWGEPGIHMNFAIESFRTRNLYFYHLGEEVWSIVSEKYYQPDNFNIIYSCRDYRIYSYGDKTK